MRKNRKYIIFIGITALLFVGYLIADNILFNGIKPNSLNENGFQAKYFVKENTKSKAAVILIGGGQWGDYWAQQFANKEMVGLSIPYIGKEGLPRLPEEIELEYFENAINWLREQPEVDPNKIVVMGASRNAELALVIASTFPKSISGVIAYAPSSVSWSNTVLPYNSNELKPSWKYKGIDIPYVPMDKISGSKSSTINTLGYWENGLSKKELVEDATIKVEKIKGPILLLSGKDDQVWPSSRMADMLEKRLVEYNFKYQFENIQYDNTGHLISGNPESNSEQRTGKMSIQDEQYTFEYGGTNEGDFKAKQDAKVRVFQLITNL